MFMLSIYKIVRIIVFCSVTLSPCTPVLSTSNRWLYIHRNGGWWRRQRRSHDIIIFVETKLDNLDILNVPNGYSYITKNRKKMCKKSGGIVIIYKSKLENCLSSLSPCTPVLSTSNRWLDIHRNGGWWWRRRKWWMIER
jgi:hypothetical protein